MSGGDGVFDVGFEVLLEKRLTCLAGDALEGRWVDVGKVEKADSGQRGGGGG